MISDYDNYGPRKLGASSRAVPGGRALLRPVRLHDVDEPPAPTSPAAVERLRWHTQAAPSPQQPPRDMFAALKTLEDMIHTANRKRDAAHVDWSELSVGNPMRPFAHHDYSWAKGYAEGLRAAQGALMGERS